MRRLVFVTGFLIFAMVMPATAAPHPDATFRSERVYFHCVDGSPFQNVTSLQGASAPWDTTAPAASVTDGAGCGHLEYGVGGGQFDAQFTGTFTGNLNALTVHLHEMAHSNLQPFGTEVLVTLEVDGVERLSHDAAQAVPAVEENSGATNGVTFTITGLGYDGEEGDGETTRNFTLTVGSPIRGASLWVWDTSEVPAGITFNPTTAAPTVFPAG